MNRQRYETLYPKIEKALAEKPRRDALYSAMKHSRDKRANTIKNELTTGLKFREETRAIKERCLEQQEELLQRFVQNARGRGAQVFLADDGEQAIDYVLKLARARQAKTCAKSKSLTSEEIQINHPMEDAGVEVIETDLGELIIQKVHEKPYHLVFPAVHKTAKEVAEIFEKIEGKPLPADPKEIMVVVRKYLRPIFLNADIGMTGANVGIADTGAIVIETNEGNARLVSSIPDVHICIMGIEKIVETAADALMMAMAHPVSATGQMLTTYVTIMAGRNPLGDGAGRKPRETHIIVLDNGRRKMRDDPVMHDALNCIRCGACMNICPTYGVVGGHTFGYIYPGPIGIPWTSEVHGQEKAGDFADLCISCGLCKEICPVQIDIPFMIANVKHRDQAHNPPPYVNRFLMMAESFAKLGSLTAPLANFSMKNKLFRWLLEKTVGIDRRRALPEFRFNTFDKWFQNRPIPAKFNDPQNVKRKVAFFHDIFANYNAPELGIAAVEALEARGAFVVLPPQQSSGYPYIGYGDLDAARKTAAYNVEQLVRYVREGFDIVATEPTATYCLAKAYPKLLHNADAELVGKRTFEIFEYLTQMELAATPDERAAWAAGDGAASLPNLNGRTFGFHSSCHQRPIGSGVPAMNWLRNRGATVTLYESGTCCGMAGTFGLKAGPLGYGLSQAVGEPLFNEFKKSGVDTIVTESSVCAIQLREGTGIKVIHPLELLKRG